MKRKLIIKEKNKSQEIEIVVRDVDHVRLCEKFPAQVWKNKKKVLPRHRKYKDCD